MDWNSYITVAKSLYEQGSEAANRSAVSRAYYALYNKAYEWYYSDTKRQQLGVKKHDKSSHYALWEEISKMGSKGKLVANNGQMLRIRRNSCDYDKKPSFNLSGLTKASVAMAERSIKMLPDVDA